MFERFLPWLNWGITTTFVLFQFFMQATAGLMANRWAIDFSISQTQVGNLSAAFFYFRVSVSFLTVDVRISTCAAYSASCSCNAFVNFDE